MSYKRNDNKMHWNSAGDETIAMESARRHEHLLAASEPLQESITISNYIIALIYHAVKLILVWSICMFQTLENADASRECPKELVTQVSNSSH